MARACQCDICGDLYTPYDDGPNSIQLMRTYTVAKYYDCCPACMATLQETINMLGDNKNEKN